MIISMDKQYRTKCGWEVRIYAVDGGGNYTIHGAYSFGGAWISCTWEKNGNCPDAPSLDLIEVKPRIKREMWYNVYPHPNDTNIALTKCEADQKAHTSRIACVKVTIDCEEGEGL